MTIPVISDIQATVRGKVLAPGDEGYEEARTVVMGGIDRKPAVVIRAADATDVVTAVGLARESGAELAVRSGGHSSAGHSTTEGGIQLDIRSLNAIAVDPETRTAWVGAGATASDVTNAAAEYGLALGFGDTGSVGVGGITLSGGIGFLARRDGLTIDNLLAAELVTADGQLRQVDADNHPDLFWAIRGGGGNFGVVTKFKFRLAELPHFYGGFLILPASAAAIAGFVAAAQAAPDELTVIGNVMPAPPMPFLAEEHHGKLVIFAMVGFAGETAAAEQALAPFRALATPLADLLRPMPYPEMFPANEGEYHPTAVAYNMFVDTIDDAAAAAIYSYLSDSDAMMRVAQLRVHGGAIARVPAEATAFAHRANGIMVNLAAFYTTPEDRAVRQTWLDEFAAALNQGTDAGYSAFIGDEGEVGVRRAYPGATYDRLAEIKATYDPTNLFRLNQNIPPKT